MYNTQDFFLTTTGTFLGNGVWQAVRKSTLTDSTGPMSSLKSDNYVPCCRRERQTPIPLTDPTDGWASGTNVGAGFRLPSHCCRRSHFEDVISWTAWVWPRLGQTCSWDHGSWVGAYVLLALRTSCVYSFGPLSRCCSEDVWKPGRPYLGKTGECCSGDVVQSTVRPQADKMPQVLAAPAGHVTFSGHSMDAIRS